MVINEYSRHGASWQIAQEGAAVNGGESFFVYHEDGNTTGPFETAEAAEAWVRALDPAWLNRHGS